MRKQFQIMTVTPVAVGTDAVLSPFTDFVRKGKRIYVLDKEKLAEAIAVEDEKSDSGATQLMDKYIDKLYAGISNNSSSVDLEKELINKLDVDLKELALDSYEHFGIYGNRRQQIKVIVKNGNQPFIPGSSIKGAFKGALLYHWLKNDGQSQLKNIIDEIYETFREVRPILERIEQIESKDRLEHYDKRKVRELKREIVGKREKLDALIKEGTIKDLLTENKEFSPREFSNLRVSDTGSFFAWDKEAKEFYEDEPVIVQQTTRLHYKKGTGARDIPVNTEAIRQEFYSNFNIGLIPKFQHAGLKFLNNEETNFIKLFEVINTFSLANVNMELNRLDTQKGYNQSYKENRTLFRDYHDQLRELKDKLQPKSEEAYFCVGAGKSYFYNSIGLAIYEFEEAPSNGREPTAFSNFYRLYFLGKSGQRTFPITRPVTDIGEPMGWVRIRKSK